VSRFINILVLVVVVLALIGAVLIWGAPVALSLYAAHKAPDVTRVAPAALQDLSISPVPGQQLSYFGYQFEVPWNDIDDTQTKLYPHDKPTRVILTFQSGLRLMVTSVPAGEWVRGFSSDFHVPPSQMEATFGKEATRSDYNFDKMLYEFTPDTMAVWSLSPAVHNRDNMLLLIKSVALSRNADGRIFTIQNPFFQGFQQGNLGATSDGRIFSLYSDTGRMEFALSEKNYKSRVSQAEVNRIVQSLRRVTAPLSSQETSARSN
jgi:hypothetical protein